MRPPRSALSTELEASLLREIMSRWQALNNGLFQASMRPPIFRLIDSKTLLGRWLHPHRTIEISRQLVLETPWVDVLEVLKHEMAHQYVFEVLLVHDETAHGPAFQQVCTRLGIDAAASGRPCRRHAGGARDRILEKVSGLLALAESPNRHEAETAAAVAQRLMLKHNIAINDRSERRNYGYRHLGEPTGRASEHIHLLAAIIAEHFFVEAIWVPAYRPHDGKRGNVLEICGSHENLELAGYVWAFLSTTAERLWKQHKRANGIRKNRHRRTFLAGVMEGFHERLRQERRANRERGLVWLGDAKLHSYHRKRHPHVRTVRLRGHGPSDARCDGRAAGRGIVLHQGVKAQGTSRRRALPPKR